MLAADYIGLGERGASGGVLLPRVCLAKRPAAMHFQYLNLINMNGFENVEMFNRDRKQFLIISKANCFFKLALNVKACVVEAEPMRMVCA